MAGGVLDGQAVNQSVTNSAFLFKNADDTTIGVVTLANTTAASSGPQIDNAQGAINILIDGVGGDQHTPATSYGSLPANTIDYSNTHEQAIGILARLFQGASGHAHDGTDGNGPLLSVARSIAASGYAPLTGDIIIAGAGGTSVYQSGQNIIIGSGGGGGGGGTILVQELAGIGNGINTNFPLSQFPASSNAVAVFVDGFAQVYSQAFGVTGQTVGFNPGFIPSIGQDVYAIYSVASSMAAPSGIETHGSKASPVLIAASAGIVPTSAADQVWWVAPTTIGAINITAIPAISAGVLGQRLTLFGVSASNYLIIPDGSGTDQNGDIYLNNNQAITYYFDGSNWSELSRRQ